ncbi:hypothetical protein C8Q80DRAFT_597820 [Daedaleopsis nitida]|nr:hypothetical protein C8Q80DRAFT_597820 [Daedaleopsis nitida]
MQDIRELKRVVVLNLRPKAKAQEATTYDLAFFRAGDDLNDREGLRLELVVLGAAAAATTSSESVPISRPTYGPRANSSSSSLVSSVFVFACEALSMPLPVPVFTAGSAPVPVSSPGPARFEFPVLASTAAAGASSGFSCSRPRFLPFLVGLCCGLNVSGTFVNTLSIIGVGPSTPLACLESARPRLVTRDMARGLTLGVVGASSGGVTGATASAMSTSSALGS